MSKRPLVYEDYSKSSRYRLRRRRREEENSTESSSDDSEDSGGESDQIAVTELPHHPDSPQSPRAEFHFEEPEFVRELDAEGDQSSREEQNDLQDQAMSESTTTNSNYSGSNSDFSFDRDDDFDSDPDSEIDPDPEQGDNEGDEDPILYPGAPLTVSQSLLSILTLSMSHNLTGSCLSDILDLISMHCIEPHHCKTTLHHFHKYFADIKTPLIRHYYCSVCFGNLASKDTVCENCNERQGTEYFIEIPILRQLSSLFQRSGFYELLNYRFTQRKQTPQNYEDIYDGALYREVSEGDGNMLADRSNISLMWYTDGVKIFKSSQYEVWPLYFSINELPYSHRFKKENIILAGLWFGLQKPVPELFIRAFHPDITNLRNGIYFSVPHHPNPVQVKGVVLCGVCDMPAKALFLNFKQYNANYGCHKCKIKGERVHADELRDRPEDAEEQPEQEPQRRGPGVNVYPFERYLDLRTDEETRIHAREALESGQSIMGVKGPSAVALFVQNYVRCTAVDLMHLIINIVKQQNSFWFDSAFSEHDSSLRRHIRLVDRRIQSLTPPRFVQRLPRSIIKHGAYWNASELKMWLFYYSVPLLCDLMSHEYFIHHKLLVMGLYLLCQSSISVEMLTLASRLLTEYVSRYEVLYGLRYMSCNIHSLLHLPAVVRELGPLWTTSCFPFESLNGIIKSFVHGTRFADLQICNAASMFHKLNVLKSERLIPGSKADIFCEKLSRRSLKLKCVQVYGAISIVGQCLGGDHVPAHIIDTLNDAGIDGLNYKLFHRLLKSGTFYCSQSYDRALKTKSSCVKYIVNNSTRIGVIQCFVRVTDCECQDLCECNANFYAIIERCVSGNPFNTDAPQVQMSFIHLCTPGEVGAVNIECLSSVCFYFVIRDRTTAYAVEPVNRIEIE